MAQNIASLESRYVWPSLTKIMQIAEIMYLAKFSEERSFFWRRPASRELDLNLDHMFWLNRSLKDQKCICCQSKRYVPIKR